MIDVIDLDLFEGCVESGGSATAGFGGRLPREPTPRLVANPPLLGRFTLLSAQGSGPTTPTELSFTGHIDSISPDARYLVDESGDVVVVRVADQRTVFRATSLGAAILFTAPDEVVAVVSRVPCDLGRVYVVDLESRTKKRLRVHGIDDGIDPVASFGRTLVVVHTPQGDHTPEPVDDGVSTVDLRTGRSRRLAAHRIVSAVTSDPDRIWVTDARRSRVYALDGRVVAEGPALTGAATVGGTVAYGSAEGDRSVLHFAGVGGPTAADPTAPVSGPIDEVVSMNDGETVAVHWEQLGDRRIGTADRSGIDLCNVALRVCAPLALPTGVPPFGLDLVGGFRAPDAA